MFNSRKSIRPAVVSLILVGAFLLLHNASHGEAVVPAQPLHSLPYAVNGWSGQESPIAERVIKFLSVTDYTNRVYSNSAQALVQLYVGYYETQKTGDTIHSPKNCIPGSGWDPVRSSYATIKLLNGRQIVVNDYVIQRDQDRQLVFYWYQGRGRVIASEYSGKFWMVADAISRHRTDGALVRLITPMQDGEENARARLTRFTQDMFPQLENIIPN